MTPHSLPTTLVPRLFLLAFAALSIAGSNLATGQDPAQVSPTVQPFVSPDLQRLSQSYADALSRATKPVEDVYVKSLVKLRDGLTKAGKLQEALAVDAEIARMGGLRPPVGQQSGSVLTAKVRVTANNPDAWKLGPVKLGDTVVLQYASGKWKDHGSFATEVPDDPKALDTCRLVVALPSVNGTPGEVLATVPPLTVTTPFQYQFKQDLPGVVLRILGSSDNKKNPGEVFYHLRMLR